MFFKSGSAGSEVRSQMRGGKGDTQLLYHVREGLPAKCRMLADIRLEPGSSIGYHIHEGETEIYLIKSGVARIMDDDTEVIAHPGDSVATHSGHGHSVESVGGEALVLTAVIILE